MYAITFVLLAALTAAQIDSNISNGTCYWSANNEAPSRYIPCGNSATGQKSCCESGDMCLSSNACYNGQFGVTYLAGCTDPDFQDSSCPNKGQFADQTYVGLVYCNGTSSEWTGCEESTELVSTPDNCWCPEEPRTVLFRDAARLDDVMSLPTAVGQSVAWQAGHGPFATTSSASSATSSISTSSAEPTTTDPSTTSSPPSTSTSMPSATATASGSSGLSTGAKAGIGAGVAVGVVIALAVVGFVFWSHRRRKRSNSQIEDLIRQRSPIESEHKPDDPAYGTAFSGYKSELPANESVSSPSTPYDSYSRHSTVSALTSSEIDGSPVNTNMSGHTRIPSQGKAKMDTVYEMPA